ncbi:WD40-repeat-containing domain protein [Glomus cerebriforme]|uniref:Ribosome biogenesis protein NSA1 n=1 Tax=Glomus cerebriforme TaxID=658196 RepID=A0A397SRQ6_9GLOM|nr:WD40-repeat-containing domain protein [Glomus cerebriforme]
MKIFTGDEAGLIKSITISEKSKDNISSPIVKIWGKIDRSKSIQLMYYTANKKLVVARKNGQINIHDPNEGKMCQEFFETQVVGGHKSSARFHVGDVYRQGYRTSSATGTTLTLVPDLCRLRVHSKEHHIFACGGRERELSVWDINAYKEGTCFMKTQKEKESKAGLVWMSKNVSHDYLDLRVPVWITDLQFLNDQETTKLIRIYDTKVKRRPVSDFNIGDNPVVSLIVGRNSNEIFFTDTIGNVFSVDMRTGKILGQFKGFAGSVTSLAVATESSLLATVAMDRFLRIHEIGASRKLINKVYLKQRLTYMVVDESEGDNKQELEKYDSEEEKIWENMEEVKPKKRKTKH